MKYNFKRKPKPNHNDIRIKTRFLWFPKVLDKKGTFDKQLRWLETASWKEFYSMTGQWLVYEWND